MALLDGHTLLASSYYRRFIVRFDMDGTDRLDDSGSARERYAEGSGDEDVITALAGVLFSGPLFYNGVDLCEDGGVGSGCDDSVDSNVSDPIRSGYVVDVEKYPFACTSHPKSKFEESIVEGDYHAWAVDRNNVVYDYPIEQLQFGAYATSDIVRRPWDASLTTVALPYVVIRSRCDVGMNRSKVCEKYNTTDSEDLLKEIHGGEFPHWMCYQRAQLIRDSDPDEYAIVLGSLGYRQPDGSIVWLCG